jgi:hypothetical protein
MHFMLFQNVTNAFPMPFGKKSIYHNINQLTMLGPLVTLLMLELACLKNFLDQTMITPLCSLSFEQRHLLLI